MKKILIIYENFKELKELIAISEQLQDFKVDIISPSLYFNDQESINFLESLQSSTRYTINVLDKKFLFKLPNKIEKFLKVLSFRKFLYEIDVTQYQVILSGVQIIFSRILYKKVKKTNIPFYVYHRHLLFHTKYNSRKKIIGLDFFQRIVKKLNIDEFFLPVPNVGYADKYLVLGQVNKNYLLQYGINENDIYITGSLEFDNLNNVINENKNNNSIIYITSAFDWINDKKGSLKQDNRVEQISQYAMIKKINLTIRVHPREHYEKYYKLVKKYPFIHLEFSSDRSIIEDLSKYDLIIGWLSTAMFEAAMINKKVLFYIDKEDIKDYKNVLKYIPNELIINNIEYGGIEIKGNKLDITPIIYYSVKEKAVDRISNIIQEELNVE